MSWLHHSCLVVLLLLSAQQRNLISWSSPLCLATHPHPHTYTPKPALLYLCTLSCCIFRIAVIIVQKYPIHLFTWFWCLLSICPPKAGKLHESKDLSVSFTSGTHSINSTEYIFKWMDKFKSKQHTVMGWFRSSNLLHHHSYLKHSW